MAYEWMVKNSPQPKNDDLRNFGKVDKENIKYMEYSGKYVEYNCVYMKYKEVVEEIFE